MPDPKRGAPSGQRKRGDGFRRFAPRRKVCAFCADKNLVIDYKDAMKLRRFLSDRAKIEPRRKTGTCARHQRRLTTAMKRARHLAMLPFTSEHIRWSGGVGVRSEAERQRGRRDDRHDRPMHRPPAVQEESPVRAEAVAAATEGAVVAPQIAQSTEPASAAPAAETRE